MFCLFLVFLGFIGRKCVEMVLGRGVFYYFIEMLYFFLFVCFFRWVMIVGRKVSVRCLIIV